MEQYVTQQFFYIVIGAVSSAFSGVLLYWISAVKNTDAKVNKHREDDAREFSEYKLQNQKIQSDLQRLIDIKNGDLERTISNINLTLDYLKKSHDELKQIVKHQ